VRGKAILTLPTTYREPCIDPALDALYIARNSLYPSVLARYMAVAFDEMALAPATVVEQNDSYGPGWGDGVDRRGTGSDILSFFSW
jgi:hypothetical protein